MYGCRRECVAAVQRCRSFSSVLMSPPPPHTHITTTTAAAILRKLRQAIHDTDPAWVAGLPGWQLNDTIPPCSWRLVSCELERVVAL